MLGGLYGDLAADTYLRDKKAFYCELFDEQATLSQYGHEILAHSTVLGNENLFDANRAIQEYRKHGIDIAQNNYKPDIIKLWTILFATSAWWHDEIFDSRENYFRPQPFEKEEGYFYRFINILIPNLLHGDTKDEVYSKLGDVFKGIRHDWDWKHTEGGMLSYLLRAWDCFYNSFDFGSAIHNAVQCVGDIRLNATLTGMIAEAMYGCEQYYIKRKYAENGNFTRYLELPKPIAEQYQAELEIIKQQERWQTSFFKKNNARTNVEWHKFTPIENRYARKVISSELRRRILKAFYTGWDARYGFYLDNGWIYLYRSFYVIGRFRLKKFHDDTYRIVDTQCSEENMDFHTAMEDALHTVEHNWEMFSDFHLKYYPLFYGNPEEHGCPYPDGSDEAKFWHGEKMFYETQRNNIGHWLNIGRKCLHTIRNPKLLAKARRLGPESFAVVYYINELYEKWCPMDDNDWVLNYYEQ